MLCGSTELFDHINAWNIIFLSEIQVFWVCPLVNILPPEISVAIYQSTQHNIPEDSEFSTPPLREPHILHHIYINFTWCIRTLKVHILSWFIKKIKWMGHFHVTGNYDTGNLSYLDFWLALVLYGCRLGYVMVNRIQLQFESPIFSVEMEMILDKAEIFWDTE